MAILVKVNEICVISRYKRLSMLLLKENENYIILGKANMQSEALNIVY